MNLSPGEMSFILAIFGTCAIIFYRLKKRYKEKACDSVLAWLDHNMVEIPLWFTMAPNAATTFVDIFKKFVS